MPNSFKIIEIIEKLNPNLVYTEYIIGIENVKLKNNDDSIQKYVDFANSLGFRLDREYIRQLNREIMQNTFFTETELVTRELVYFNYKETEKDKLYFYIFQGFSYNFVMSYKSSQEYSYLKFVLDKYFEDTNTIKFINIEDYLTAITREYVQYIMKCVSEDSKIIINLFDEINYISTLTYEGVNAAAKLLIINKKMLDQYINFYIEFEDPIYYKEYRKIRKLLETSDNNIYLIGDYEKIYGLGKFKNLMKFERNLPVFIFNFTGKFEYSINSVSINSNIIKENAGSNDEIVRWTLSESLNVNITYGKPDLNENKFSESTLVDLIKKTFSEELKENEVERINAIKQIVNYAKNQKHGTTLVFTTPEIANSEVRKLKKQSIPIKDKNLFFESDQLERVISRITCIDGSVYFDIEGKCHAIGVILDGLAQESMGDSSRGARYNSSIRYIMKDELQHKCIIVIISEDGMVNIIPDEKDNVKQINMLMKSISTLYRENKFDEALEKLNQLIKLDNRNSANYNYRGIVLFRLNEHSKAISDFEESIKIDDNFSSPYNNKAMSLIKLGRLEEALEFFNIACNLDKVTPQYYVNKISVLKKLGRVDEAIQCGEDFIKANKNVKSDKIIKEIEKLKNMNTAEAEITSDKKATERKK
jgi:Tfp pilus assembly protein PilF